MTHLHPGLPHCPGVVADIVGVSVVITVVGAAVVGAGGPGGS